MTTAKAVSLDEQVRRVREAFDALFEAPEMETEAPDMPTMDMGGEYENEGESEAPEMPEYHIVDVYPDAVICCKPDSTYWRVPYTMNADGVTFAPMAEWEAVEKEWIAAKGLDILVFDGASVKSLSDDRIGGYLVIWGNEQERDLQGEFFTKTTDFCLDWYKERPTLFHHGLDGAVKSVPIGTLDVMTVDDTGLWVEGILNTRNKYVRAVKKLIEKGALGWSSGTLAHLREVKANGEITKWPIVEGSITHMPAEPRTYAVPLKSLPINALTLNDEPEAVTPEAVQAAVTAGKSADVTIHVVVDQQDQRPMKSQRGEDIMTDTNPVAPVTPATDDGLNARLNTLEATTKATNDRMERLLDMLEKEAPNRKGGVLISTPNTPAHTVAEKSLGDWFLAVRRGDDAYLEGEYGTVKSMTGDQGASGSYPVPEVFDTRLLGTATQQSQIMNNVFQLNVTAPSGKLPVLDFTRPPTAGAGDVAMAGGLTYAGRAEAGSYTETQAYFEQIQYNVNSESLEVQASIELMADSAMAIESLLTRLFGTAMSARIERHILRGDGVGKPLGILNAPAAIGIAADTANSWVLADAAEMDSRFLKLDGAKPYWIMHSSMKTDLAALQVSAGGVSYIQNIQNGTLEMPLLNYPILFSEHLPQADNSGCVILADLNAYVLFKRGGLSVFYSEHTRRTSGKVAWYVDYRLDGQPWLSAAVTDASPQGSFTKSPFIYNAD